MIKLEITDVSELKKLDLLDKYDLEKHLKTKYPKDYKKGEKESFGVFEEILEYLSRVNDTDNICEVYLDLGAGITVTYGYIIE